MAMKLDYKLTVSNGGDNTRIDMKTNYFDENMSDQASLIKKEDEQNSTP